MTPHRLKSPPMLDPRWLASIGHARHAATVGAGGTIELAGETLRFENPAEAPPAGAAVRVWLGRWFYCATQAELDEAERARETAREEEKRRRREELNRYRQEAETFNARVRLPVAWDVGIKDVLSGLTETSLGDGRNRKTVKHVLLLEPLQVGRLKRKARDFLCSISAARNGKRWSGQTIDRAVDGDGNEYAPAITCKSCLQLAARLAPTQP
jgi:hypothetical protein